MRSINCHHYAKICVVMFLIDDDDVSMLLSMDLFICVLFAAKLPDARCQRQSAGRCLDRQNCQCCTGFLRKQGSVDSESDPSVASDPSGHCHPVRTCSQMKGCRLSDKVRAVAFVTLGRPTLMLLLSLSVGLSLCCCHICHSMGLSVCCCGYLCLSG